MQKKYRLKKGFQFNYIYRKGKSVAGKEMILYFAKNRGGKLLIGVSVSKKIGKSTVRNRIKRLFKESARSLIPRINHNCSYILLARSGAVDANYQCVLSTLENLLIKSGNLAENSEISGNTDNKVI